MHRPEAEPLPAPRDVVYWRVNGYRAAMLVWTDDEFAAPGGQRGPADAQHFSCGIWAVLRMVRARWDCLDALESILPEGTRLTALLESRSDFSRTQIESPPGMGPTSVGVRVERLGPLVL